MNKNNLINLKERTAQERKAIASKGGKASAVKRKEEKEKKEKAKSVIEILTNATINLNTNKERDLGGVLNIFTRNKSAEIPKDLDTSALDLLISNGLEVVLTRDKELQNERLKATRMLYDMKQDKERKEERKQEREFRHNLELKELELKERALELEERKVKVKEELIAMKNRGAVDVDFKVLKKEPKLLEAYIKKEQKINKRLSKELQEEIIGA